MMLPPKEKTLWFLELSPTRPSKLTFFALAYPQLYFNPVLIYTDNKAKLKEGKRRNGFAIIFLFTSKIKTYYNTFSLFEERIYYLNAFSWQQLAIIRQKNRTFVLRKRGELLDGKLSFPWLKRTNVGMAKMAIFSTAEQVRKGFLPFKA